MIDVNGSIHTRFKRRLIRNTKASVFGFSAQAVYTHMWTQNGRTFLQFEHALVRMGNTRSLVDFRMSRACYAMTRARIARAPSFVKLQTLDRVQERSRLLQGSGSELHRQCSLVRTAKYQRGPSEVR